MMPRRSAARRGACLALGAIVLFAPDRIAAAQSPPPLVLEDVVAPATVLPGAVAHRRLVLATAAGSTVEVGEAFLPGREAETAGPPLVSRVAEGTEGARWTVDLPFRAWRSGIEESGPVPLRVDGVPLERPPVAYAVAAVLPSGTRTDALAGPLDPPARPLPLAPVALAGAAVLGGVVALRRRGPPVADAALASGRAGEDARRIDAWPIAEGPNDVLEWAAAARLHPTLRAIGVTTAMTTEEAARTCARADPELADALYALLAAADGVKFAGASVSPDRARRLGRRFLEATLDVGA